MAGAEPKTSVEVSRLLGRLLAGDESARASIVARCLDRVTVLARRHMRGFPGVARWEQTDDVVQEVTQRLERALRTVRPRSPREFFNLCSRHIRFELIEFQRKHFGREGIGANHASPGPQTDLGRVDALAGAPADGSDDPARLARWTELHTHVDRLPDEDREVFDLIWYHDLTHANAAAVMGVSTKTVSRRWRQARLRIHHLLEDRQL